MTDEAYVTTLLTGLRAIKDFKPQLGKGKGVSLKEFQSLYAADPLYHWMGFDSELMYAAHRASGAMTSLYRNLGTGCEHLIQRILSDRLKLTAEQLKWEYVVGEEAFEGAPEPIVHPANIAEVAGAAEDIPEEPADGKAKGKKNSLDARIDLADLKSKEDADRIRKWLERLKADRKVTWEPVGAVFEVRQGYKSMDAKRQAADIANAAQALARQRLPVLLIVSNQIDDNLIRRYGLSGWGILRGIIKPLPGHDDALQSTYAFLEQVVDYDLQAFFERNQKQIRQEVHSILETLLRPP